MNSVVADLEKSLDHLVIMAVVFSITSFFLGFAVGLLFYYFWHRLRKTGSSVYFTE